MTNRLNSAWLRHLYVCQTDSNKVPLKIMITLKKVPWFLSYWPLIFSPLDLERKPACNSLNLNERLCFNVLTEKAQLPPLTHFFSESMLLIWGLPKVSKYIPSDCLLCCNKLCKCGLSSSHQISQIFMFTHSLTIQPVFTAFPLRTFTASPLAPERWVRAQRVLSSLLLVFWWISVLVLMSKLPE